MIEQALQSGQIVDFILMIVIVEVIALTLYWWKTGNGLSFSVLVPMVGAGTCLMLAMRAVLVGSPIHILAFWLLCSLVFHVIDLRIRWSSGNASS